jgi:hypothetical protein
MNWIRLILLMLGILAHSTPILAKTVNLGNRTSVLTLTYGEETLLRFPSAVKTVSKATRYNIQPANTEEPDYSVLSIKPRFRSGSSNVVFLLDDGTLAKVRFVIKKGKTTSGDGIYDFKKHSDVSSQRAASTKPNVNEFDLLKAMIRGHRVTGYRIRKVEKKIKSSLSGLKLSLYAVYRGGDYAGYIYELENVSKEKTFDIDIRKLAIGRPNLAIVSSIGRDKLTNKKNEKKTYLYVVAKSSASFRRMALPVSVVEGKKKGGA